MLRVGPDEASFDQNAFYYAAQLVACDLGYPCGRERSELLYACVTQGSCAAADYREHLYQYDLTAAAAQSVHQYYEQLLRARTGDWSYFTFHRGQSLSLIHI